MRQPPFRRNRSGRLLGLVTLLLAGSLVIAAPAMAGPPGAARPAAARDKPDEPSPDGGKIESNLAASLGDKGSGDFYVDFSERADLAAAAGITDWVERGAAVVKALQATAEASQAEVRKELDVADVSYTSFWISNTILVRGGSQDLARATAEHTDVKTLRTPETFEIPQPEIPEPGIPQPGIPKPEIPEPTAGLDMQAVNDVEWGIDRIRADDVWSTFGVRGEGVVVASIDSGVDFQHPALINQYRGNNGGTFTHDYNWFDPSHVCDLPAPCDNNDHGTHTMGTMVGDDGIENHIGVAPRARWISAKGCESNTCSDAALLASGQWMLAPTRLDGTGADPAQRPNIVNNSWGGAGGLSWFSDTIDAWRASGIFPAFSAGNSGPACSTAGSPGDDEQAFASGAFDVNGAIASFSGRGGAGGLIKPNLAAPGVNVRSSIRGGAYATLSGTSMASPHTAGTVALMWSAAPALVGDFSATAALLDQSAADTPDLTCGGTGADNNVWGEGKLDALAAVTQSPRAPAGTLTGAVTDAATGAPIVGARVVVSGPFDRTGITGADGSYTLVVPVGDYTISASVFGYQPQSAAVTVTEGQTVAGDLALTASPAGTVTGVVSSVVGPVANATVTVTGTPIPSTTTDAAGGYSFAAVPFGSYPVTVSGGGRFTASTSDLTVHGDETLDVTLPQRTDGYGYSCRIEAAEWDSGDTPLALVGDDKATSVDLPFPSFFYGNTYPTASCRPTATSTSWPCPQRSATRRFPTRPPPTPPSTPSGTT